MRMQTTVVTLLVSIFFVLKLAYPSSPESVAGDHFIFEHVSNTQQQFVNLGSKQ